MVETHERILWVRRKLRRKRHLKMEVTSVWHHRKGSAELCCQLRNIRGRVVPFCVLSETSRSRLAFELKMDGCFVFDRRYLTATWAWN